MSAAPLDAAWRRAHPLPDHAPGTDKNGRGRVLLVGGSTFVPGALRLTGEGVLRSGAGKLQIATVDAAAVSLGVLVPEAAMIALPTDRGGEIGAQAAERLAKAARYCDCLLLGPAMVSEASARALVQGLLPLIDADRVAILDAAAITCCRALAPLIGAREGRVIMTPHHGEMARLTGLDEAQVARDPIDCARSIAAEYDATIVLKSDRTVIATSEGEVLAYSSDCVGLATGGSGDVLAGVMAGLVARGADPLTAAGWAVWLHGEAGRRAARRIGPIGFLARDLAAEIPGLMAEPGSAQD